MNSFNYFLALRVLVFSICCWSIKKCSWIAVGTRVYHETVHNIINSEQFGSSELHYKARHEVVVRDCQLAHCLYLNYNSKSTIRLITKMTIPWGLTHKSLSFWRVPFSLSCKMTIVSKIVILLLQLKLKLHFEASHAEHEMMSLSLGFTFGL